MHDHGGVVQRLPQGIAVGARRLQGHHQVAALSQATQQVRQRADLARVVAAPGPLELALGPAQDGPHLILADVQADPGGTARVTGQEGVEGYVLDSNRPIRFASCHGDDLQYVGEGSARPILQPTTFEASPYCL